MLIKKIFNQRLFERSIKMEEKKEEKWRKKNEEIFLFKINQFYYIKINYDK